jgi:DNA-binding SARP family transcriptional activator
MDYRLLGPLEVLDDTGTSLTLGGAKQRAVLTILLLHAGELVSADRLMDDLWGEDQPETAANTVQVYISQLRRILRAVGVEPLVTHRPGYRLDVGPDELDLSRSERLAAEARERLDHDDAAGAALRFREALALWRGEPLADFAFEPFATAEVERLLELRLVMIEDRYEAELEAGRHAELVPDLEALLRQHPNRERMRAHLMLATYRAGRQADALAIYQEGADLLAEELGIDPGPDLRRLHEAILRQEDWVGAPVRSVPAVTPGRNVEAPRGPTQGEAVLIVGVAVRIEAPPGISSEDWEPITEELVGRIQRSGEAAGASVPRRGPHGIDLVFGLPAGRSDDLDRASRLALRTLSEARTFTDEVGRGWDGAVPDVRVGIRAVRLGIGADRQPLWVAQDDPVGAGSLARSHGGASAVMDAATARRLSLGWTWTEVDDGVVALVGQGGSLRLPSGTPFVGRQAELSTCIEVVADVEAGRGRILLVEGEVGSGKTRLLEELRGEADGFVWVDALTLRARGGSLSDAVDKEARQASVGLVVDDVHRLGSDEQASFADALGLTDTAPVLVAMTLDPAMAERSRELWGSALTDFRHRVAHLTLGPLPDTEARVLAEALSPTGALDPATRDEVVARAEGNPLYLEELIRSLSESGGLERGVGWTMSMTNSWMMLPPSLEGVLAGRIQHLPDGARHLAQVAAIVGREFSVPLAEGVVGVDVGVDLAILLRSEVVREVRRSPELVCQFRHRLLQDAALATLTPARARELYGRVGRAFEARTPRPDAQQTESLAFYFYRSDDDEAALRWLEAAGRALSGARRAEVRQRIEKVKRRLDPR